ncbi:MAG TPA: threonine ammonia-lyase [Hyphomicrobiales bacterium]|nr:threonine ammonia-lyase [Hyphomicrobiales bacterium]
MVTLADIKAAAKLIDGQVLRTPLIPAPKLSALTGADIFVKYENLQVTNAFKERGALVRLLHLSQDERARGVIAMSAGNHAQAVAYHAARLGIPATIVMPQPTPLVKIENTENQGARVVLSGETLAEAQAEAERLQHEQGFVFVHPFDDPHIIAGQGTIALEMLDDRPDLDCLVVPVGGGGLIAGNAVAAKALKPEIAVIGVEAALYASMTAALAGTEPRCGGQTLAEGIAVAKAGRLPLEIARERVDGMVQVSEAELERAVNAFLTLQKTMAEGAGAAGLAALIAEPERFKGRKVGLILAGGNIDPRILASIMVRELQRQGRIVSLRVTVPDRPGMLGRIATCIGANGGNILEVFHHRLFLHVPAQGTSLDLMIEVRDEAHTERVIAALREEGFAVDVQPPGAADLASR